MLAIDMLFNKRKKEKKTEINIQPTSMIHSHGDQPFVRKQINIQRIFELYLSS